MYIQIKKGIDKISAILLLLVLLPVLVVLIVLLTIHFKSSPFYFQKRIGKDEKEFVIYKFKSMKKVKKGIVEKERITPLGAFLRKTGLDETLQLINIIKGEMSFVGPRPLLKEYLPLYSEEIRQRHTVMPGITGFTQINGGNNLIWEERFQWDLKYVRDINFKTDLMIILKTVLVVLGSKKVEDTVSEKYQGGDEAH